MARTPRLRDAEDSLAVRAAWLHYAGGLTQAEVAKRLGITSVKAHRLITKLAESGAVKVTIDGDVALQQFTPHSHLRFQCPCSIPASP